MKTTPTNPTTQANKDQRFDRLISGALVLIMLFELLYLASGINLFGQIARATVVVAVIMAGTRFGLREIYLISFCAVLSVVIWRTRPDPVADLSAAFSQAAFLMSFILLVGLMQQAASSATAIKNCGVYLTKQPASRRYLALFGGTHLMTLLFNLGVISLLTPLIMRGTEDSDDPLNPIRQRRQLMAVLRGFSWAVIWSPTAIAPLVLVTMLPEAKRLPWIGAGIAIAFVIMLVGWAEDHWSNRNFRPLGPARILTAPPFPRRDYLEFFWVCITLAGLTLLGMWWFEQTVPFGLMFASPLLMIGWLWRQNQGKFGATWTRVADIYHGYLPRSAPIAVTLGCSGFIGRAAAVLIPSDDLSNALGIMDWPGWLFLWSLAVAIAVLSHLALSPIMMAVFFGSLIAEMSEIPASYTWTALAISCGWSLSMTASPFATIVLMMAQMTGHSGTVLTWKWNWLFTLLASLVLAIAFYILTGGT